ncbi:DUF2171 domain-containing protein [Pantoea sp.]|uniref:DUF2171 domain-containing protein n=1 Tax=Pantoea sp. TaxID=69393 RepID=UPI0028A14A47|nr:DUF2171 domain-containing protein [Pantoea sp.]
MVNKSEILDHAQVVDVDGEHVGVVDHLEGEDKIKLAKSDPNAEGHHHIIPLAWVKEVNDNKVILSKSRSDVEASWQES